MMFLDFTLDFVIPISRQGTSRLPKGSRSENLEETVTAMTFTAIAAPASKANP